MAGFSIVWLRNDLRCYDNAALHAALGLGLPVVVVFIATPKSWSQHQMAPIKQDLLRRRVQAMQQELALIGGQLLALEGDSYQQCAAQLASLAKQGAQALFAQTEYEVREQQRDASVTAALAELGVPCHFIDNQCRFAPGTVLSKTGDVYKVFTPFKKTWLQKLQSAGCYCLAKPKQLTTVPLQLPEGVTPMLDGDNSSAAYPVSEQQVLEMLRAFCRERVQDYQQQRDFPAKPGTSGLSAYLAIGVISAQQAIARLQLESGDQCYQEGSGAAVWLSELIWREFYKHILVAYPKLIKHQPFQQDTAAIVWGNNPKWFDAWCEGKTGYPIVDAAMRQLNQTGWMHNRLRMIVASFLVKDLQIDWRWGEAYFMSKLIDGDFAANNGGWQWAASTGTDAAPYFRIFNPVTQSERFDPNGDFIRLFVPELAALSNKQIHWPHPLPMSVQYVKPIVDHAKARLRTLEMFNAVKNQAEQLQVTEITEKDSGMMQSSAALQQFVDFYNGLSANNLTSLATIYHPDVQFIDPVHEIHGVAALEQYFAHAYARLNSCHFAPVQQAAQGNQGFLSWTMTLSHPAIAAGKEIEVQGCSALHWHTDGRIIYHRDYYDLTDMVYRHIPLLGWLTAKVKQKMAQD